MQGEDVFEYKILQLTGAVYLMSNPIVRWTANKGSWLNGKRIERYSERVSKGLLVELPKIELMLQRLYSIP